MSRPCSCDHCTTNPVLPIEVENDRFDVVSELLNRAVVIQRMANQRKEDRGL